jgi:hypothetical protein
MWELVATETKSPHRIGGLPRVTKSGWPWCPGCKTPLTSYCSLELPELAKSVVDPAGIVVFACSHGCANPTTKSKWSVVVEVQTKAWKKPLKAPIEGAVVLPESFGELHASPIVKFDKMCDGYECKRPLEVLVAFEYEPGHHAQIAFCSERHTGANRWFDDPPLTSGFEKIQACWDQYK